MRTVHAKKSAVERRWILVDAENMVLGRMCTRVADLLRGKVHAYYTPHVDTGDYVIVVNAEKVKLTGKKWDKKMYYDYSGYMSGLRERTAAVMRDTHPVDIITRAVRGMLPKGILGEEVIKKLKVYAGPEHPHEAQKPVKIEFEGMRA